MICCSIGNRTAGEILSLLEQVEMAEIRLDLCRLSDDDIEEVFSSDTPLIATYRTPQGGDYREAERQLALAVRYGARYLDLEIEAPKPVSKRLASACAEWGTTMIRSYHNSEGTPSIDELRGIADKCRHHDGEIVKIVTFARDEADNETILSLYKYYTAESLVAFAMGSVGTSSRLECLRRGAPFSYAAPCNGASETVSDDSHAEATAPGQMAYDEMYREVYGTRKALGTSRVPMPSSKSYTQRAILAAALADGVSVLKGYTECSDNASALAVAAQLGADVRRKRGMAGTTTLEITGIGPVTPGIGSATQGSSPVIPGSDAVAGTGHSFNVGESGLLARLMMPLGCRLYPEGFTIEGEGTLSCRVMQGARSTIEALGGRVIYCGEIAVRSDGNVNGNIIAKSDGHICESLVARDIVLPVTIEGPLRPGRIEIDGSKTSQLVSGALMALPLCSRNSTLCVRKPASIPYIYITMDILRKFGVKLRSEMYGGRQLLDEDWSKCTEIVIKSRENQVYKATELTIEGDWSAAAAYMAAGAVFGGVELEGLDTSSLQADLTMVDILMAAGASISQENEPTGVITVRKAPLQGIRADLSNCPDLFPVVAVLCTFCQGRSSLKGLHRLAHKESDRAGGIVGMLEGLGVRHQVKGNELTIEGESLDSRIMNGRLLKGGRYTSNHDHRMVMALSLAELGADAPLEIDDVQCVGKSYPGFNDTWNEYIRKKIQG